MIDCRRHDHASSCGGVSFLVMPLSFYGGRGFGIVVTVMIIIIIIVTIVITNRRLLR